MQLHKPLSLLLALGLALGLSSSLRVEAFRPSSTPRGADIVSSNETLNFKHSRGDHFRGITIDSVGDVLVTEVIWLSNAYPDGSTKHLVRFFGALEGTGVFMTDSGDQTTTVWAIESKGESPKRIEPRQRQNDLFHFGLSWEDLLEEREKDYRYHTRDVAYLDGVACNVVVATPRDSLTSPRFARRELWITRANGKLLKGDFFDQENRLLKTIRTTNFKEQFTPQGEKISRPNRILVENYELGTTSVFVNLKRKVGATFPEEIFSIEFFSNWSPQQDQRIRDLVAAERD